MIAGDLTFYFYIMAKKKAEVQERQLVIRKYEYADTTDIWTFDYTVSATNPISVEIIYKEDAQPKKKKKKL